MKEWLNRYAIAEIISVVFAIIFSYLSQVLFGNFIVSGIIGTWSSNLGFYGTIVYRDIRGIGRKFKIKDFFILLRNMIIEFGPAEYLDSLLIRPFYLSFFPFIISNYSFAIFIGTMLADVTYFIPTIISYEFRRKIFKN